MALDGYVVPALVTIAVSKTRLAVEVADKRFLTCAAFVAIFWDQKAGRE